MITSKNHVSMTKDETQRHHTHKPPRGGNSRIKDQQEQKNPYCFAALVNPEQSSNDARSSLRNNTTPTDCYAPATRTLMAYC